MKQTRVWLTFVGVAALLAAVNVATAEDKGGKGGLDAKFVKGAASGGMFEVKSSELAGDRATSADVKKFAEHMVRDHGKANKELMDLCSKKGIEAPKEMQPQDKTAIEKLSSLQGAEFDRAFMKAQLAAHKEAVALFEEEAKNGKDQELRSWAEKTLPTLRDHLSMAMKHAGEKPVETKSGKDKDR